MGRCTETLADGRPDEASAACLCPIPWREVVAVESQDSPEVFTAEARGYLSSNGYRITRLNGNLAEASGNPRFRANVITHSHIPVFVEKREQEVALLPGCCAVPVASLGGQDLGALNEIVAALAEDLEPLGLTARYPTVGEAIETCFRARRPGQNELLGELFTWTSSRSADGLFATVGNEGGQVVSVRWVDQQHRAGYFGIMPLIVPLSASR